MAAFSDLLDLRTATIEQVGSPEIADIFPRLVTLAEARFNRELRLRDQITEATLTLASGTAALPSDFLEMIGVYNAAGCEYVQQTLQQNKVMDGYYAISGGNLIRKGYSGDLLAQYYAAIPTITSSMTASNWLLSKYPGIYLYGVAFEAAKSIRDKEMAADMGGLMQGEISEARADDERSRYSRARVRIAGVTP